MVIVKALWPIIMGLIGLAIAAEINCGIRDDVFAVIMTADHAYYFASIMIAPIVEESFRWLIDVKSGKRWFTWIIIIAEGLQRTHIYFVYGMFSYALMFISGIAHIAFWKINKRTGWEAAVRFHAFHNAIAVLMYLMDMDINTMCIVSLLWSICVLRFNWHCKRDK